MGTGRYYKRGKSNIDDNVELMKHKYPLTSHGYFGQKGKNSRIIRSSEPVATSIDFYKEISRGGVEEMLSNGHGVRTTLCDGTIIVHRIVTSSKGSPAVDIKIMNSKKVKSQKIHFITREAKG
jgi:hypothetical protein